ncbi:hypothetical protein D3C87_1465430 [compost metagenome]
MIRNARSLRQTVGGRKVELGFADRAAFGRDNNYPIRSFCTKNRCGRCIFQYRYRRDFIRVHIAEIALYTVDHYQWLRTIPARKPAYDDLRMVAARLTALLHREHARELARERIGDVGRTRAHERLIVDLRNGTDYALLPLRAVAYHHHLFQSFVFGYQLYVQ